MTHLTDEELESLVRGEAAEPAHLAACADCRARLAEHRALAARLRSVFDSVHAGETLAERIRQQVVAAAAQPVRHPSAHPARRSPMHPLRRAMWASMAAAAAVLILAVPVILHLTAANSVVAASAELVRIHTHNLSAHGAMVADADPARLAEHLKTQLGFQPAAPRLGQGMAMRGCCVAHFKGEAVGSYVVETPVGPLSIIVVPQMPEALGMKVLPQAGGRAVWADSFAMNNMAAVRLGDYTYCAVGQVPRETLVRILAGLG